MTDESGLEQQRLSLLVGRWFTQGRTAPSPGAQSSLIDAIDTYDWLPGRFALLHTVDARVGDTHVEGAEIIGWIPSRRAFVTQYFGTDGPNAYEATLAEQDGALVWRMQSESDRFAGTFSHDRTTIVGHWEQRNSDGSWRAWMDVTLTRQPPTPTA